MTHPQAPARPDEPRAPEIPREIMQTARLAMINSHRNPETEPLTLDLIARAIMAATAAQQERDITILQTMADETDSQPYFAVLNDAIAAIRAGS